MNTQQEIAASVRRLRAITGRDLEVDTGPMGQTARYHLTERRGDASPATWTYQRLPAREFAAFLLGLEVAHERRTS